MPREKVRTGLIQTLGLGVEKEGTPEESRLILQDPLSRADILDFIPNVGKPLKDVKPKRGRNITRLRFHKGGCGCRQQVDGDGREVKGLFLKPHKSGRCLQGCLQFCASSVFILLRDHVENHSISSQGKKKKKKCRDRCISPLPPNGLNSCWNSSGYHKDSHQDGNRCVHLF